MVRVDLLCQIVLLLAVLFLRLVWVEVATGSLSCLSESGLDNLDCWSCCLARPDLNLARPVVVPGLLARPDQWLTCWQVDQMRLSGQTAWAVDMAVRQMCIVGGRRLLQLGQEVVVAS